MKCELCGIETELGNPYFCFYGKRIRSETSPAQSATGQQGTVTISTYKMGGLVSAWFCDRCVATRYGKEQRNPSIFGCLITGFLTLCCPSLLIFHPGENLGAFFKIIAFLALIIGLMGLIPFFRGVRALNAVHGDPNSLHALMKDDLAKNGFINAFGDGMVINREKTGLKNQGFDSFFTRKNKPTPI